MMLAVPKPNVPMSREASPTDAVGDIAHGHQQTRQGEGVDVTDPQQLAGR